MLDGLHEEETGNEIIIRLPLLAFQLVMFLTTFVYSSCVTNFIYIFLLSCPRKINLILILRTQVCSLRYEMKMLNLRNVLSAYRRKRIYVNVNYPYLNNLKKVIAMLIFKQVFQQFQLSNIYRNLFHHVLGIYGAELNTSTKIKRKFKSTPNCLGPKRKLPSYDQFLLMWMIKHTRA